MTVLINIISVCASQNKQQQTYQFPTQLMSSVISWHVSRGVTYRKLQVQQLSIQELRESYLEEGRERRGREEGRERGEGGREGEERERERGGREREGRGGREGGDHKKYFRRRVLLPLS